ncbi:hypothetical protein LOK46_10405 [Methylobacterium sp. NMS14P]|uniref:hypothetical protein n=1 Tax=Methylobacterium sp. NMS14P TaxID=2894310 RepID=UPI002359608D|nr:hypothetical protein [Methylobacterium sp. NMS14P]WCS27200.1 hypothetical protein LOK46_10405 [Methylobacterium sp. NMS14P]
MPEQPISQTHVTALRACAFHSGNGMRHGAHKRSMQALAVLGYVEERTRIGQREPRWFLTPAGRDLLEVLGSGEDGSP